MMNDATTPSASRRLPAEWEDYEAVLIAWPHKQTDWEYILDEITQTYVNIVKGLIDSKVKVIILTPKVEIAHKHCKDFPQESIIYVEVENNDTWARDFGVITCEEDGAPVLCDFKFNGWGLKFASDKDNLITRKMQSLSLLNGKYENHLGFVLEGGSIESDGKGTILTTSECLCSLNRNGNLSREEIAQYLSKSVGAKHVLWLDHGYLAGDDTDSHIDTLARLVSEDTIVYVKCSDESDEHYNELSLMEEDLMKLQAVGGSPYNLIGLPLPDPIFDEDGNRLPATYANFLITPRSVLLPIYNQPAKDLLAEQMLKIVFSDREIITVDCNSLIKQHGSLHCVTMQIPFNVIRI
ncbi:MAG: agmatine deiminase family protein [Muribaculaceae bacterium]|nr:agmatine deiminase family protein [Muribaculaceae bacterium]